MTNGAAIFDPYSSASMLLDDLAAQRISATALLEAHVTRFQKLNPQLNAVIKTDLPRAREAAARLDRDASNGKIVGPLHGLPMTVKDTFDVNGLPAVAGAPEYADRPARVEDAAIVKRLKDAGAVIWGKTNTPYLAGDCQTYNSVYGVTNNPYDPKLTPGGSSGGAAAALAAGVTPLELGSDIGGSLRTPAHFCGVCSLKPSYGRISVEGHIPPAPGALSVRDLNVVGPMARNVADLKRLFSVIADTSTGDNASPAPLNMRRLAIWSEDDAFPLSQACKEAVKRTGDAARDAGAQTAKAKPDIDGAELLDTYMQLLIATLAGDLPPAMLGAMEAARPLAKLFVGPRVFTRAKWAVYSTARHTDWLKADEARAQMKSRVARFFQSFDAIIAPVTPTPAFAHMHEGDLLSRRLLVDGAREPYGSFLCWMSLATACHLPAAVIPAGKAGNGFPVGVQIIGAEGEDEKILDIAEALERQMGGFQAPNL